MITGATSAMPSTFFLSKQWPLCLLFLPQHCPTWPSSSLCLRPHLRTPAHRLFHLEPLLAYEHLPLDESRWLILLATWKSTRASRTWPSNLQDRSHITLSGEGIFSNPTLARVQVEAALMTIVFKHGKGAVLPPLSFHCSVLLQAADLQLHLLLTLWLSW